MPVKQSFDAEGGGGGGKISALLASDLPVWFVLFELPM